MVSTLKEPRNCQRCSNFSSCFDAGAAAPAPPDASPPFIARTGTHPEQPVLLLDEDEARRMSYHPSLARFSFSQGCWHAKLEAALPRYVVMDRESEHRRSLKWPILANLVLGFAAVSPLCMPHHKTT